MEINACLLCGRPEPCEHYHPDENVRFVCSRCVQALISGREEKLRELYEIYRERRCPDKMETLKSFMKR